MAQNRLLNFQMVCQLYGFKPWGLRHRIRTRQIPFVKLGKSIFFDPEDLDRWIEENKIPVHREGKNGG